jgi:ribokinase
VRVAVVGHVEWIELARVPRTPAAGEIVHSLDSFETAGGGGAVTGVQLARLAGGATFITALGDDELGHRALAELRRLGLDVHVAWRDEPQRRAFVHLEEGSGERTITVIGSRLGPSADDPLPWERLADTDAVYFTAGDAGAARAARAARTLVGSARSLGTLEVSGVGLDVLVASGADAGERYERGRLDPEPRFVVRTAGARGGRWEDATGAQAEWVAAPVPGPVADAYGCGDSFAGGLAYGLGAGLGIDRALELGARCGATCLTGRGPYGRQLTAADL